MGISVEYNHKGAGVANVRLMELPQGSTGLWCLTIPSTQQAKFTSAMARVAFRSDRAEMVHWDAGMLCSPGSVPAPAPCLGHKTASLTSCLEQQTCALGMCGGNSA